MDLCNVMLLLFNMLSKLVKAFLPRSKCLLISWLQSLSAVILEPPQHPCQNKVCHCFPIYLPWSDGTGCHDLSFLNVEFSANFFTLLFHWHQLSFIFVSIEPSTVSRWSIIIQWINELITDKGNTKKKKVNETKRQRREKNKNCSWLKPNLLPPLFGISILLKSTSFLFHTYGLSLP